MSARTEKLKRKEVKTSAHLRKLGIELPSNILRFWDKVSYVDNGEGTIEFPYVPEGVAEIATGYIFASDAEKHGGSFLDDEIRDLVWYYLFDRDPRYEIRYTYNNVDVFGLDENYYEEQWKWNFSVYDKEARREIFKGTANAIVTITRYKPNGEPEYGEATIDYIVLKPMPR
jgi:hypothetical protein